MSTRTFRLALMAAALVAAVVPGQALAKHNLPPQAKDLGGVVVATGQAADKEAVKAAIDAYVGDIVAEAEAKTEQANATARVPESRKARTAPRARKGSGRLSGYASRGWSCSSIDASFSDSVSWPWWGETSADVNGSSSTHWWGSCPYNAASVNLSDTICFDAISFNASFSGVGFSSSGGGCGTWSATIGNNWMVNHYYSGVHGSAGIGTIYRVRQGSGGTYRFGSTFVGVNANGGTFI